MKTFFTPKEVAKIVGISYRQIQYWDKTNFIKPSYRRRGKYRLYTFQDLIQMKLAKVLRGHQFSIQRLRKVISHLRDLLPQVTQPLADLTFLIDGERILIFSGEVIMNDPSSSNYVAFRVLELCEEINEHLPELYDQIAAG